VRSPKIAALTKHRTENPKRILGVTAEIVDFGRRIRRL